MTPEPSVIVDLPPSELRSPPSSKPQRVPFYDDDAEARRRRLEPTVQLDRSAMRRRPVVAPDSPMMDAAPRGSRVARALVVVGLLLVAGAAAFLVMKRRKPNVATAVASVAADPPPASASASVPAPASASPPLLASSETAPPAPSASASQAVAAEETVLTIETVPLHVMVSLGGVKKGVTPLELRVPKGREPITIELRRAGYQPLQERIVPDVNQRLKLTMTGAAVRPAAPAASSAAPYHRFE